MIGLLLALLLAVYENTILDVMQLLRNALQITNWIQTMLDIMESLILAQDERWRYA